ncbi:hypothetical protein [Streptomyces sp. NBC_00503]|uniref:hypothetical protein n=1 Tax=Streptomyces sp. NBC_00503 TaxID=2903659 RepID=UPI002E80BD43|nr:hypothetical protein [Streptomyces sp. NBC_00503]WUD82029.1 hypothetical protein OG490_16575 [Streptomyces sp. NBC_00503]
MTTPRMYLAVAALSALALGVAMASGWGQDWPDALPPATANVQHADVVPTAAPAPPESDPAGV